MQRWPGPEWAVVSRVSCNQTALLVAWDLYNIFLFLWGQYGNYFCISFYFLFFYLASKWERCCRANDGECWGLPGEVPEVFLKLLGNCTCLHTSHHQLMKYTPKESMTQSFWVNSWSFGECKRQLSHSECHYRLTESPQDFFGRRNCRDVFHCRGAVLCAVCLSVLVTRLTFENEKNLRSEFCQQFCLGVYCPP